jgi:hypothetical protein
MPQQGNDAKKQLEHWRLARFREQLSSFPEGTLTPCEEPDFLIKAPARTIGIELTELHRDVPSGTEPPQAQEALRHRAVKRAQELHEQSGLDPLHVSVHFSGSQLTRGYLESLAQAVARAVATWMPASGEYKSIESDYLVPNRLPPEIAAIGAYNLPGASRSFFTAPGATWMAKLQPSDVERALQSKEAKYVAYRGKCDEAWLVIGCNGEFMSTWFEDVELAASLNLPTSFDRAFLMSYFDRNLVEL